MALKKKFKELSTNEKAQNSFLEDIYANDWDYGLYSCIISPDENLMSINVTLHLTGLKPNNDEHGKYGGNSPSEESKDQG